MKISSLLTILFIGLKLSDHIDWSWWWIFSPLWISFCVRLVWMTMDSLARYFEIGKSKLVVIVDDRKYEMNSAAYGLNLVWTRVGGWQLFNARVHQSHTQYDLIGGEGNSDKFEVYLDGQKIVSYKKEKP